MTSSQAVNQAVSDRHGTDNNTIQTPSAIPEKRIQNPNDPLPHSETDATLRNRVLKYKEDASKSRLKLPILFSPGRSGIAQIRPREIVSTYFDAIESKNDEIVALCLESGLVTTETKGKGGFTPLLAAVETGHVRTIQRLMDFYADINAYGITEGLPKPRYRKAKDHVIIKRTPLQFAAEKGHLPIVKLLMETYQADDSLIAPDGQHALRLAATNGHREIVQYLPTRRGGGWRRWKMKHRNAAYRIRKAGRGIYEFFEIVLWIIPKGLVWEIPKALLFKPMSKGIKWLSHHREELPAVIAEWLKRMGKKLVKAIRKTPRYIWDAVKATPRATKRFLRGFWRVLQGTPIFAWHLLIWIWGGIEKADAAIIDVVVRFFSFLHTTFAAIISRFQNLTFKDVIHGFEMFLRALFVNVPKQVWIWLCTFEKMTLKLFEALFGGLGCLIWLVLRAIVELFIHVPKKLAVILAAFGQSMGAGCKEVMIWFDPKRS